MTIADAINYLEEMPKDEPVFILRGQDLLAPSAILYWCWLHEAHGGSAKKRTDAVLAAAELMRWERKKLPD